MFTVVTICNNIREKKSWIVSLMPFHQIFKERNEEDEEIHGDRLTEE